MSVSRELICTYTGALRRCSWRSEDSLGKTVFKTAVLTSQKSDCVGDACCRNIYLVWGTYGVWAERSVLRCWTGCHIQCSNQCTLAELNAVCFSSVISFRSDLYRSCRRGRTSSRNSAWSHAGGLHCWNRHTRIEISRHVVLYLQVALIVVPTQPNGRGAWLTFRKSPSRISDRRPNYLCFFTFLGLWTRTARKYLCRGDNYIYPVSMALPT
jgi:hypothetical protein